MNLTQAVPLPFKIASFWRFLQSRFTAGAFGFLTFTQCGKRPEREAAALTFWHNQYLG
jgi:hypothetical protein